MFTFFGVTIWFCLEVIVFKSTFAANHDGEIPNVFWIYILSSLLRTPAVNA